MSSSANGINNQENLTVQPLSLHDQVLAGIIESSEQTLSLQNEVWSTDYTYQDGEWKNIDAVKFGEQFKKIQAFYNMLAVLA